MLPVLLKMRMYQFGRLLNELGLIRILFLVVVLIPVVLKAFSVGYYFLGAWIVMLNSLHLVRSDRRFLKLMNVRTYPLFLAEYFLLSLPALVFFLVSRQWYLALGLVVVVALIPLVNLSINIKSFSKMGRRSFFPADAFEWISGWRRYFLPMLLIYIAGLAFSGYEVSTPIAMLLLTLIGSQFYLEFESREMLEAFGKSAAGLLRYKCLRHLQIFWLMCLPLLLSFLVFHGRIWYVLPLVMLICSMIQVFSIIFKYASYQPHEDAQGNAIINGVFTAGILLSFAIPFFFPVVIMMLIRYYRRGVENLKSYV